MAFNIAAVEEFQDRRVRQAVSHAINTEAIVNQIYAGFATEASQPLPPNVLGHNDDIEPYPYDPEQAQSLLEEAGYGDGFSFELATFQNPRGYNPAAPDGRDGRLQPRRGRHRGRDQPAVVRAVP